MPLAMASPMFDRIPVRTPARCSRCAHAIIGWFGTVQRSTSRASNSAIGEGLQAVAREVGFDAAGVARVDDPSRPESAQEAERFAAWVDAGRAGEMSYLQRRDENGELVRGVLLRAMPWARSVIVCALN